LSAPRASRPYMRGYGIVGPDEGRACFLVLGRGTARRVSQLLGRDRMAGSAATRQAGLGHLADKSVWFSSSVQSRKARNLRHDPRCVVTTDNPISPSWLRV
jgi:Pyridoxamine 5'-phosphate oxidase